jgi:mRNA-degrading endonuclease RelE of RelBE toxin-antitoxin system
MSESHFYSVKFTPKAERDMKKIPSEFQKELCEELISLSGERHPKRWMHRIIGYRGLYSVRAGDYRAVVSVQDRE